MGDLDRRKHDVDIIERVLGGIRDTAEPSESYTRVVDVDLPHTGDSEHSTLELTVSLEDSSDRSPSRRRS
jgi:hypothetical protein